jgi:hypothetical protein
MIVKKNKEEKRLAGNVYEKNHEKILSYNKKWRESHKKEIKEYRKKYRNKNHEKVLMWGKKWRNANKNYYKEYSKRYTQKNHEKMSLKRKKYNTSHKKEIYRTYKNYVVSAAGIWSSLGAHKNRRKELVKITKEKFISWYDSQEKVCLYCGISENKIDAFPEFFVGTVNKRLSIDRINNTRGYEEGNLALSCRRCNSVKSDFFSGDEMKTIAEKYITPKWKNRK